MALQDKRIRDDKVWIMNGLLSGFEDEVFDISGLTPEQVTALKIKKDRLRALVWSSVFGENLKAEPEKKPTAFSYKDFDVLDEKTKTRKNLIALWEQYLKTLSAYGLSDHQKLLLTRLRYVNAQFDPAAKNRKYKFPADEGSFWGKCYKESRDKIVIPHVGPVLPPPVSFNPSYVMSNLLSAGGGFALSYAMRTASKATICTAMAGLGFTGLPVMIIAGVGAGLVAGVGTSIVKNLPKILSETGKAEGWKNKAGVFAQGCVKSVHLNQLFQNAAIGVLGSAAGTVLAEGLNHCLDDIPGRIMHAMGLDTGMGHQIAVQDAEINDLHQQVSSLQHDIASLQTAPDSVQHPVISATGSVGAGEAPSASVSLHADISPPAEADQWPDYIKDPKGSFAECKHNVQMGLSCDGAAAAAPAPHIEIVSQADLLNADATTIVVAKGDNLTHLIEQHYGLKEGSKDFDKVLTEIGKSNGLKGNEENWLKIGWKLTLPSVNPDVAVADIDRVALDANWQAKDVVFSRVPQFA